MNSRIVRLGRARYSGVIPLRIAAKRHVVHAGSQTFAALGKTKPEEPVKIIERYLEFPALPQETTALHDEALSNAHLISTQIYFRYFRVRQRRAGFSALWQAFALGPRSALSLAAARQLSNAAFNRIGDHALWIARRAVRATRGTTTDDRRQGRP